MRSENPKRRCTSEINERPCSMKRKPSDRRNGAALVVVVMVMLLCTAALNIVLLATGTRVMRAYDFVFNEQAFFLAEAGVERAAVWVGKNLGTGDETVLEGNLGNGRYVAYVTLSPGSIDSYDICATGTVRNVNRGITVRGVQNVSWSQFALWYDKESPSGLWFVPGEVFDGRVYSRPQMKFSASGLNTWGPDGNFRGPVHFSDRVETAQPKIDYEMGAYPELDKGLDTGVDLQTMAEVDFDEMLQKATDLQGSGKGLVLEGDMTIELDGRNMKITSTNEGDRELSGKAYSTAITNHTLNLVYVKPYTYSYKYRDRYGRLRTRKVSEPGDVTLKAPQGFSGDISVVAENDIRIADHVRYADNPEENPESEDKLGLVAQRNVVVQSTPYKAPDDLEIYAHIFCKTGGFGVENYDSGVFRGNLKVYGGIANDTRRAVGTFYGYGSRTGYIKQYFFDKRFKTKRPRHYPITRTAVSFSSWEG